MVRKAVLADLGKIENNYTELFDYEKENGAFTAWIPGIYPTKDTAQKALLDASLYVVEQNDEICASMILNHVQPKEYEKINWRYKVIREEVLVIHLLCVTPSKSGTGLGTEMLQFAIREGKKQNCKVIRLDTGLQNKPAIALYTKLGFQLAGTDSITIGGMIEHSNHLFFELKI